MDMTNSELKRLKELALKAAPFGPEHVELNEQETADLRCRNAEFFVVAVPAVPELVDELLDLRSKMAA